MLFSNHNEKIKYINHYSGLLEVKGEGALCREDAEICGESGNGWTESYDVLSITDGITALGEGYLEAFLNIRCLILSRTVEAISTTPEFDKMLRKNKVLIRGEYESFAEEFARNKGLKFIHSDIHIADDDIEIAHEHDIITLRFHEDGSSDIHYNCFTPGSSAGSYGGGEYANKLPSDFYIGCTIEQFAANFSKRVREQILANEAIKRFLESANRRHRKR